MILVDTSVWIDFFRGATNRPTELLIQSLNEGKTIFFTGIILQEILQGCHSPSDRSKIENHFDTFIELFPQRSTYRLAAKLYGDCNKRGYTIRSSIDCLIAACAIEQDCFLLHHDRDYTYIQKVSSLKIH